MAAVGSQQHDSRPHHGRMRQRARRRPLLQDHPLLTRQPDLERRTTRHQHPSNPTPMARRPPNTYTDVIISGTTRRDNAWIRRNGASGLVCRRATPLVPTRRREQLGASPRPPGHERFEAQRCTGLGRTGQHHTARDGLCGQEAQVTAHQTDESGLLGRQSRVSKPFLSATAPCIVERRPWLSAKVLAALGMSCPASTTGRARLGILECTPVAYATRRLTATVFETPTLARGGIRTRRPGGRSCPSFCPSFSADGTPRRRTGRTTARR
jgi:hypothetical protein